MERPATGVELPLTGIKVQVYDYYLRGERKEIEAIMLKNANFEPSSDGSPKLGKIDLTYRAKMEDKSVLLAIKSVEGTDGEDIKPTVEFLDNLPDQDFNELKDALPEAKPKKK